MGNLRRQLYGLIIFRLVAVTSLLVSQVFLQALVPGAGWNAGAFFLVLSAPFLFTAIYLVLLRLGVDERINAYLQFTGDVLVISGILYLTGGLFSPFANLYFVVVIVAATFLYRHGALVVASEAFLAYGIIVLMTYWRFLPSHEAFIEQYENLTVRESYFWLFLYMFGLYAVAYLTSRLSEMVRGERSRAERSAIRVRELEQFHRTLVESMTVGLLTTDEQGRITFASPSAENLLGRTVADLEGRTIDGAVLGEGTFGALRDELADSRWARRELTLETSDGRELTLGVTASRLGGPVAGYLFLAEDLSEIKRLEEEVRVKDRMAAMGEMAAGLAHEIRNPLASMTGSVGMLARDLELEGEQERLVDIVQRESKRLDGIIRDFLEYARPRPLEARALNLADLARETLDLFRHSAEVDERFELALTGESEVWCRGDANRLRQVLWNLLRNSREAMPEGGRLEVDVRPTDDRVRLAVRDEGMGMTEEERTAAVQPFRSGSGPGVGLGLTIVYRIIRDHGGEMRIDSRKGEGTTIVLLLPAARAPRSAEASSAAEAPTPASSAEPKEAAR